MSQQAEILVTGGTGFLGSYLLRYLLRKGKAIRATKRVSSPMDLVADIRDAIEWVDCDLLDQIGMEDCMDGIKQVYHCAAMVSFDTKDVDQMREINVNGTANIVNIALEKNVEKFLHVSSIAAIGRAKPEAHISEKSKWERSNLNSNYAISKYLAEQEVWRAMVEGLNVVIVNPSVILGAGYWEAGSNRFFKYVWRGSKFKPGGCSGFVDVRDVARLSILLMDSDVSGERYIANGENLAYGDVFQKIADTFQKPAPTLSVRPWMREIAWRVEWLKSKITRQKALLTKETARLAGGRYTYDNSKSKAIMDFEYTPIAKTVEETGRLFADRQSEGFGLLEL